MEQIEVEELDGYKNIANELIGSNSLLNKLLYIPHIDSISHELKSHNESSRNHSNNTVSTSNANPTIATNANEHTSSIDNDSIITNNNDDHHQQQSEIGIEVSPMAMGICESVSKFIAQYGGAALFIDYGENRTQGDSLRGYQKHKQVNFLSQLGNVDITADVDFHACANAVRRQQQQMDCEEEREGVLPNQGRVGGIDRSGISDGGVILNPNQITKDYNNNKEI